MGNVLPLSAIDMLKHGLLLDALACTWGYLCYQIMFLVQPCCLYPCFLMKKTLMILLSAK